MVLLKHRIWGENKFYFRYFFSKKEFRKNDRWTRESVECDTVVNSHENCTNRAIWHENNGILFSLAKIAFKTKRIKIHVICYKFKLWLPNHTKTLSHSLINGSANQKAWTDSLFLRILWRSIDFFPSSIPGQLSGKDCVVLIFITFDTLFVSKQLVSNSLYYLSYFVYLAKCCEIWHRIDLAVTHLICAILSWHRFSEENAILHQMHFYGIYFSALSIRILSSEQNRIRFFDSLHKKRAKSL